MKKIQIASALAGASLACLVSHPGYEPEMDKSLLIVDWNKLMTEPVKGGVQLIDSEPSPVNALNPFFLPPRSGVHNNVLHESREPVTIGQSEYYAIGRIKSYSSRETYCSAFLVADKSLPAEKGGATIVTAGHCFIDGKTGRTTMDASDYVFAAQYIDRETGHLMQFWSDIKPGSVKAALNHGRGKDMAMATLEVSPPDEIKPFPIAPAVWLKSNQQVISVGYPADKLGMQMDQCRITSVTATYKHSNCDLASGASGSPILKRSDDGTLQAVGVSVSLYEAGNFASQHLGLAPYVLKSLPPLPPKTSMTNVRAQFKQSCISVIAQKLNVRSAPRTSSTVIGQTKYGVITQVLSTQGKWYEVPLNDGGSGYIHSDHARIRPCPKP